MEFQDYFQWFLDKYGYLSEQDRINSKELSEREWNPTDAFEALVTQLMDGITHAQFMKSPISDIDIMDITIKVIMKCELISHVCLKWHERPNTARIWLDFQPLWNSQLKLKKITMITVG